MFFLHLVKKKHAEIFLEKKLEKVNLLNSGQFHQTMDGGPSKFEGWDPRRSAALD